MLERLLTPISTAGPMGGNIPNVAFTNDTNGEAEKVAAVDIHGNLWLMDIWRLNGCPHTRIDKIHQTSFQTRTQQFFHPHHEG